MKKAGILTFHRASNYGAVLQAYALQKAIEKMGFDAEIIDYRCPAIESAHNPFFFYKGGTIKKYLLIPRKFLKYLKFSQFRKQYLKLSEKADKNNIQEIITDYSILITGSDQLWNSFNSGLDETYFLPFDHACKKYSYAVSLGDAYDEVRISELLNKYADGFTTISLREESSLEFVSSLTKTNCRTDVDPTLLLGKDDWIRIAKKPEVSNPYILIYTLAPSSLLIRKAKEMSAKTGWKIVFLDNSFIRNLEIKRVRYSRPEEFVGWFSDASFVFTNSFHGTAFSLIMNKPFVIAKEANHGVNVRCFDLLDRLNLTNRIIESVQDVNDLEDIQWDETNMFLSDYVKKSENYLKEIFR